MVCQVRKNIITDVRLKEFAARRMRLTGIIQEASDLVQKLDMEHCAKTLQQLREKLSSDTFKILVIGNFKNGKSTFINALLGQEILPAYAMPTTAINIETKYGEKPKAILHFLNPLPEKMYDGIPEKALTHMHRFKMKDVPPIEISVDEIEDYVVIPMGMGYRGSPFEKVELFWPLDLLKDGVEIVDSPGLNKNPVRAQITMEYLSKADAIIFIFSALAMGSAGEIAYIDDVLRKNGFGEQSLFCVVNHFDQLDERGQQYLRKFADNLLAPYTKHVYYTSAYKGLMGQLQHNSAMLKESKIPAVETALVDYLVNECGKVKLVAPAREVVSMIRQNALEMIIPQRRNALSADLDVLKQRYSETQLENIIHDMEQGKEIVQQKSTQLSEYEKKLKAVAENLDTLIYDLQNVEERMISAKEISSAPVDFKTQQMIQMADIDGHIRFMQTLMGRYSFPSGEKAQLQAELKKIQARQNEKTLNMAVIGEFSSGKSSFINALLRENLLETDAIQGTTVSSTLIGYSPERIFRTYGEGGRGKQTRKTESSAALAKLLAAYTSGDRKDENARYLEVGYPSDFLQQGIRIIDTPGTNSLEQWHEDVTKEAIREQADACIILTSAEKPFPESFCRFLEDNLQDVLQTCVFVVTKIDLIPPKQQARQMEYIRKVLEEKLSVHDPLILPYSALPVINETGTEYIEGNRETEERILKFLQEQRIRIQLQRCMALSENAMGRLKESMEQVSSQQKQRHDQLMQAITTDLQSFVTRKKSEIRLAYQEDANVKAQEFSKKLDGWIGYRKRKVYEAFEEPTTESDIRAFLQTKLNPLLEEKKSEILKNVGISAENSSNYLSEIQSIAEGHCRCFEADFKREYRQLELLAHDLVQEVDKSVRLDESLMTNVQANTAIRQKVEANVKQENRGFLGYAGAGAAAGAAIGSVVPIIGTTAGAVIGAVAGFIRFNKRADDSSRGTAFRNQVAGDVNAVVEQYFRSLQDSVMQFFNQNAAACWMQVEHVMDQYLAQYTGIVREMRKRDQKAQEEATIKIRMIQNDINLTQQQLEQIKSVRYKISHL